AGGGRAWNRVVHEARGDRLPRLGVVNDALGERLADPLDGAAGELSDHHHRIDDAPDVIDRPVTVELHGTRLGIDLDFTDVTAVGPAGRVDRALRLQLDAVVGLPPGEIEQIDAAVGAGDAEHAIAIFDVGCRRFELLGGEVVRLRDRALGGDAHRR